MKQALLVQGMIWGDEGKGATVDYLTREYQATLNVRFNGGSQAAHNVVTPDGLHHTFAQFGSGMFVPGVRTYLSRHMLVNPIDQMKEAEDLHRLHVPAVWDRVAVDRNCVIITPFHKFINRQDEQNRGTNRHGSCGMGVGEARKMSLENPGITLYAKDILDRRNVKDILALQIKHYAEQGILMEIDLDALERKYLEWPAQIVSHFEPEDVMVFEGAQGVLLDEKWGTPPYYTWTNCTFENALSLLKEIHFDGEVKKIGCFRTYFTRHGAGPFPTEYQEDSDVYGMLQASELHNRTNLWQREWRVGAFDRDLARHAIEIVGGLDEIALSHLDIMERPRSTMVPEWAGGIPVTIEGYGPTANDRKIKVAR